MLHLTLQMPFHPPLLWSPPHALTTEHVKSTFQPWVLMKRLEATWGYVSAGGQEGFYPPEVGSSPDFPQPPALSYKGALWHPVGSRPTLACDFPQRSSPGKTLPIEV